MLTKIKDLFSGVARENLWPFGYRWTPVPASMASSSESWERYSTIFEESQVYPLPVVKMERYMCKIYFALSL